ncbi:MAG: SPOR domain-containing protein [Bacteroidaceae bacterium]|nr:SPOR domain-containing protein [Bacteroidaceae bacterium]
MEKIINNITRLLAHHNCVIIPGIGAFLAHRVPARYNAADGIFMPPMRTLAFNPQVTVDDALLQSEYMNNTSLSYDEAGVEMTNDIDRLRSTLSSNGVVRFGELGTFSMDIEGSITFEPNENGIDDPYSFGFQPLAISRLSELEKRDIVIKRSSISKYVSIAAAIIIALFVIAPIGNSVYDNNIQASFLAFTPSTRATSSIVAENIKALQPSVEECEIAPVAETATATITTVGETTLIKEPSTLIDNTIVAETPAVTECAEEEIVEATLPQHSIIVASTPNPQKAELAISELSRKMKADYTVVEGNGRFRISIENYDNGDDATAALERIKATFPDAWIYIH